MTARALLICAAASLLAATAFAAPPLAGSWSITPSGSAASSGQLLFRVTSASGEPVSVKVPVRMGANDVTVARNIRQMLDSQLPPAYKIELGEGANVLVSDPRRKPSFSVELVDSDVESLRVAVRIIEAAASPTVPSQSEPAITLPPPTPSQAGAASPPTQNPMEALPPGNAPPPATPPDNDAQPTTPPPESTPLPAPPPEATPQPTPAPGSTPVGTPPPTLR
jgi:hypothetical protein